MERVLVAYYSFSGSTERLAREIARQIGADVRALVPERPYDFSYNAAAKEARAQLASGHCPPLRAGDESIEGYHTILIGTPNWFATIAPPVRTFLAHHDLGGRTVAPFCTHGGGGWGRIVADMAAACGGATMLAGYAAQGDARSDEVEAWLRSIGLP